MFRNATILSFVLITNSVIADISSADYEQCKNIADSLKRLICYDNLKPIMKKTVAAPLLPIVQSLSVPEVRQPPQLTSPQSPPQSDTGQWQVKVDVVNPDDHDENTSTAILIAQSSTTKTGYTPKLKIHCNSNKTQTSVLWGQPIESIIRTELSIGSKKFPSAKWLHSKDKLATIYPKKPLYFMKQMLNENSFEIKLTLSDGSMMKATFDTTGMGQAIVPIRYTCGW